MSTRLSLCSFCVKSIFWELQLLRMGGQLSQVDPALEAWAYIQTMALQEELSDDFSAHEIIIKVLHTHIQRNCVLKSNFYLQMSVMMKKAVALEKLAQQALSKEWFNTWKIGGFKNRWGNTVKIIQSGKQYQSHWRFRKRHVIGLNGGIDINIRVPRLSYCPLFLREVQVIIINLHLGLRIKLKHRYSFTGLNQATMIYIPMMWSLIKIQL